MFFYGKTNVFAFHIFGLNVFIPGSIQPVRFGLAGTVPAEISILAVTIKTAQLLLSEYFNLHR